MPYPYITLTEIFSVIVMLIIGIIIAYFFVRIFKKDFKLKSFIGSFLLYELCTFFLFLVEPSLPRYFASRYYTGFIFLFFSAVLFSVFALIMKKFNQINWKKSLIFFLVIIMILFPVLNFFRVLILEQVIYRLSIYDNELSILRYKISFNDILNVSSRIFNWPSFYIQAITVDLGR